MRKWQITTIVTILIFVISLVISLVGAGWSQRPIIDYHLAEELLPASFSSDSPINVSLRFRNRGNTDANLKLVVTVTNANITVSELYPWIEYSKTQVKFNIWAINNMETFSSYEAKVYPVGNPQNFTITYTIEDNSNFWSISGMISHLFLEPHGTYPTYVVYNRTDTDTYQRL